MIRYFISDLHLSDKRPDLIRAFVQLTNELINQKDTTELYILGDFYEAWIGDDFQASWNDLIETALAKLSQSGIAVFFLHGNRDFLIGDAWLDRVGATFIKEQTYLPCGKHSVLLTHGDEYCLEDVEYQNFRTMVRSVAWQANILTLPIEQRIALAEKLRNDSKSMSTDKTMTIMDVSKSAVEKSLQSHHCKNLIHGHTHRPNVHKTNNSMRCVLGDWDTNIWLATLCENQHFQLQDPQLQHPKLQSPKFEYTQSKSSVTTFEQNGISGMQEIHREILL